jgi:hypothetical protein
LLLSIGLRIGIFPLHLPFSSESSLRRGQGTLLRMVPAASGLVVLSRIPSSAISHSVTAWLSLFTLAAILYAGTRWVLTQDELASRPFWLICLTAFGILSVLNRNPDASLAWGMTLVFLGSALFLLEYANRFIRILLLIGVIGLLGLPFTPNASGLEGVASGSNFLWIFVSLLGVLFLAIGMIYKIQQKPEIPEGQERIIYLTYPVSILMFILGFFLVGLFGWHGSRTVGAWWYSGFLIILLAVGWIWDKRAGRIRQSIYTLNNIGRTDIPFPGSVRFRQLISLKWFYNIFRYAFAGIGRVVDTMTYLLEGSAGIFWAFLLMALFLAILNIGVH